MDAPERRSITVHGIVQGVGFRPFVHELATRLGLCGHVKNSAGTVEIALEGDASSLDRFLGELTTRPPAMARIDDVAWVREPLRGERGFRIEPSDSEHSGTVFVAPDAATCGDCLRELFDPRDRRYRYPFLNCTNCGPRLTILREAPYDRERTTMAGFAMCPACRSEYEDPCDRRYHAQPIACPACGPRLLALDASGAPIIEADPLALAVSALRRGRIVAVKGLGGYHLACDAANGDAVSELRRRKHRDEKPLAIMVRDLDAAREHCEVSPEEAIVLTSRQRPIVLLRRRSAAKVADSVAPGDPFLGVILPYTPLHNLMMTDLAGLPLVMTSGNRSDEPIAYEDHDARERLSGIADLFLANDRPIHIRCDDSVTRLVEGVELPIRRSRGYAPQPIRLPRPLRRPTLALGGQLKACFGIGRGGNAFLSHHLGDLDHYEAYRAYASAIDHYRGLLATDPARIVHDLHPDYASTRLAHELADREGVPLLAAQHHHAHVASCLAENHVEGPVIGVAFDGAGYGPDGAVWGGEFLIGDCREVRRAAHLRYVGMPGSDRAAREPWRMALAHLLDAGLGPDVLEERILPHEVTIVRTMLAKHLNSPRTSSIGRLFDAVAAIAGVRDRVGHEGQAAIALEWLATDQEPCGLYPFAFEDAQGEPLVIDSRPLIRAVAEDASRHTEPARIARKFHSTMVDWVARVCDHLRSASGIDAVALSGGVFLNALLTRESVDRLGSDGFRLHRHRQVPPGDGGLCLGQLAIAAANDP